MDPISYSFLPKELWGLIISNIQDAETAASLQRTSKNLNVCIREFMTEAVASRRVFYTPPLFFSFNDRLKNSRIVAIHTLIQNPSLIEHKGFPEVFRHDMEIKKIAFVAAKLLNDSVSQRLCQRLRAQEYPNPSFQILEKELDPLSPINLPPDSSNLWSIPSFLLHGPMYLSCNYQKAAPEIRANYEISLSLLKKGYGALFEHLDPNIQKERNIVKAAITASGDLLKKVLPQFQDDLELARLACRQDGRNLLFATMRVQIILLSEGINPNQKFYYQTDTLRQMSWPK